MTVEEMRATEDAVALERFEALVFSQQPASQPWTPVTDYSFEARKVIEGPHAKLIKEVFRPKSVCDVGCGPGHLMRMLRDEGVHVFGIDLHPPDLEGVTQADISSPAFSLSSDCTVAMCREVFEHLTILQIGQAVRNIARLYTRFVYVTTRFAKNPTHLLDVDTADDLDPTHITMLNRSLLRTLFVLEGFRRRADLEERMDWMQKGRCLVYERV